MTMKFKSCLLLLGSIAVLNAHAADYPAELRGKWGTGDAGSYCPSLEIDKKFAVMGTEQTCQAATVKSSGTGYLIKEKCSGEGGEFTESTLYTLTADGFTRTYRKMTDKYKQCGAPANAGAAPAAPTTPSTEKVLTCTVVEGSAGVTTFLDPKLKKSGNAIRDMDGYVFKADSKIKVGKADVLVGKLIRSDGSVSEAKSYAYADEWNCK